MTLAENTPQTLPATVLLAAEAIQQALVRLADEIAARNGGLDKLLLLGLHRRGVPLAARLAAHFAHTSGLHVPQGQLDVTLYRPASAQRAWHPLHPTRLDTPLAGRVVVLVDDLLHTGQTACAALAALAALGRPASVQLAVLVDRGHHTLPIQADYVGVYLTTAAAERVLVRLHELDDEADSVVALPDRLPA